jgi:hypothetical protein
MSDEIPDGWNELLDKHKEAFGDVPMTFGLPPAAMRRAMPLIQQAIDYDRPMTTEALYKALGIDPPPEDALV